MSWLTRLTNALHSRRLDDDLAEEFRGHVERRTEELMAVGLSPADAKADAIRAFGNAARFREQARSAHISITLETTLLDVRYACHGLSRRPLFAITAIGLIGGATAATVAVYTLLNASVLKPLPLARPDDLVALSTNGAPSAATIADPGLFSYPLYETLRNAAGDSARLTLLDDPRLAEVQDPRTAGSSEQMISQFVAPDVFSVLGVPAAAGQLFSTDDDHYPGARAVVVLSHDYWRRRFGASPDVIGRALLIDGRRHAILGVTADGFRGVESGTFVDLWRPITTFDPSVFTNPAFRSFRVMGRLAPGVTPDRLAARLSPAFMNHMHDRMAASPAHLPASELSSLQSQTLVVAAGRTGLSSRRQGIATPMWIVLGLAAAILLGACANVAGMVLARAEARARDVALRLALGASRLRVFRLFIVEGSLVALTGAIAGWGIAPLLARVLAVNIPAGDRPLQLDLTRDWRVLGVAVLIGVTASGIIGVFPAWRATGRRGSSSPLHVGRPIVRANAGRALVGIQVAFAFALVMTGGSFLISLRQLTLVNRGFDAGKVSVFTIANSLGPAQRPLQLQLMRDLETHVAAQPSVEGAAAAWWALFSGAKRAQRVSLPGAGLSDQEEVFYRVSPRYLETLHVPLLSGRNFTAADNDDEPVPAVVSRAFAMKYLGAPSPLGRVFVRDDGVRHEVVGVAGDSRYDTLRGVVTPIVYMPMKPPGVFTFYVRSRVNPVDTAALVSREATALGFGMRVRDSTTLDGLVQRTLARERILATIGGACAGLGLVLAAFGLFGLLNYSVTGRIPEIGVRSALGSGPGRIVALLLKDVISPIVFGLGAGLVAAVATIHWMQSFLFEVGAASPAVIGSALAAFALTAIVACIIPGWRATTVDPIVALRRD